MFVVSMIFLIVGPNMISILLGWDGLGLVSYLLVIYYQNVRSYGAGMLTVLSNRIGDVAFLIVIAWIINFGSLSFVYYLDFLSGSVEMGLISVLVVLAAMTLDGGGCSAPHLGHFTPGKDRVPICTGDWVGPMAGLDGGGKNHAPTRIRSPDRPFHSESLYRLSYPGQHFR